MASLSEEMCVLPDAWPCNSVQMTDSSGLNRHSVLHGEDTSYRDERNSLKPISHLLFVSDLLKDIPALPRP